MDVIVARMLAAYKQDVKTNYIFKEPMKASSYYALFQTIQLGNTNSLIFNPRNNKDDVKVFAAVATSWDTYYPGAERGKNLHNIAIEGMKDIRIIDRQRSLRAISHFLGGSKVERGHILNRFNERDSSLRQLAHGADHFGMALMTNENDMAAIGIVTLGLAMHFAHQRTCRINTNHGAALGF